MRSESDNNIVIQWNEHNTASCPKCKKLQRCFQCGLLEDMTPIDPEQSYLHLSCERAHFMGEPTYQDRMRQPENTCCALGHDSGGTEHTEKCWKYQKPTGGGFDVELSVCPACETLGKAICDRPECVVEAKAASAGSGFDVEEA